MLHPDFDVGGSSQSSCPHYKPSSMTDASSMAAFSLLAASIAPWSRAASSAWWACSASSHADNATFAACQVATASVDSLSAVVQR